MIINYIIGLLLVYY